MNLATHLRTWINSLGGRLTLFIVAAIITAQAVGVFYIVQREERERARTQTEAFVREIIGIVDLLNASHDLDRMRYVETQRQQGLQFWLARSPAVAADVVLSADAPPVPFNWSVVRTAQKRLIWYDDMRPISQRYRIAGPPSAEERRRAMEGPPPPREESMSMYGSRERLGGGPGGSGGPPRGALEIGPPSGGPPGGRSGPPPEGPPPGGPEFASFRPGGPPPPGSPDIARDFRGEMSQAVDGRPVINGLQDVNANMGPPPPGMEPRARWRASILLEDGLWLNAEQLYAIGLPGWLETVIYQNGAILLLMLLFVIPVVFLTTQRLNMLAFAADKLGRGETSEPLPESGTSEIRQLTQAFNNMSLRLRRFVQGRTEMLAGISHDLRTPITALRLRADLVDDDENRERMQALITDMQHLTEATLTLAKDESFTEKTDTVDISTLIEGICDDLTDAGIDSSADVERGVTLKCRPFSLRRAIRNLAENGAKYGKRSRISLQSDARNVRILVDDDGPGIPEDQMERAFQPFVRLEGSRSRETGGSGLGLAITRSIVLNHGGELKLSNRSEGGLRATMILPRAADE